MSFWLIIVGSILAFGISLACVFWAAGPERVWAMFGAADLGPVDFKNLRRRGTPTDALACPSGFSSAEADIHPPAFPVDVATLKKALSKALVTERRLTRVDIDDRTHTDRFIQRTEKMRFPDTIVVRFIELPGDRSTVAIYSRSQL